MDRFVVVVALIALIPIRANAEPPREAREAIARGVEAIKKLQKLDGHWGDYGPGSTALAAIALLESGVPKTDPAIAMAARYIRAECLRSTHTYSVALSVNFFDLLAEANDLPLLLLLTERLLAGQQKDGGWHYVLPLGDLRGLDAKSPPADAAANDVRKDKEELVAPSDNSNTQFAILGLWAGHRHGIDINPAMDRVEERFRKTAFAQVPGLGWGYLLADGAVNGPRTCCALLGLAMSTGAGIERRLKSAADAPGDRERVDSRARLFRDPLVNDGFRCVLQFYQVEAGIEFSEHHRPDYYFLWSVERVAMAYGQTTIAGYDWYRAGQARILPHQLPDGTWKGHYEKVIDTSFALLFLNRSNLTKDLSSVLNPKLNNELKTDGSLGKAANLKVSEGDRLVQTFLAATPEQQLKLVEEYRDHRGIEYTDALTRLIPKLTGTIQKSVRDALAARLSRMTAATIRDRLKDSDHELRRAAAIACALKDDRDLVPDLIKALDDADAWVVRAAAVALNRLTGQDFGPAPGATPAEKNRAVAEWKKWWRERKGS